MVCRASSMPPLDYLRSSGGQMRDQAIHFFDLLRFLTGDEVRTVAAMGAALACRILPEFGDVDTSILMMQMRGGALAQLDNTRRTRPGTMNGSSCWAPKARWSPVASRRRAYHRGAAISALGRACGRTGSAGYGDLYQHLDAFIRLTGETVATCRPAGRPAGAPLPKRRFSPLQHGQFVAVD